MAEFFHMGGYAFYVWGSFGVTALCMLLEPVLLGNYRRSTRRRIARMVRVDN